MIKLVCLIVILICSSFVGYCFCLHFKRRKELFEEMVSIIDKIKEEISFKKSYYEEILSKLKISKEILSVKNKEEKDRTPFSEEEKEEIRDFFDSLGSADLDCETEKIAESKRRFISRAQKAENFYNKNGKLSIKLGILFGVAVFIAFI